MNMQKKHYTIQFFSLPDDCTACPQTVIAEFLELLELAESMDFVERAQ